MSAHRKSTSPHFHRRRGVVQSLRRMAQAHLDAALAALRDPDTPDDQAVHVVRQRLKALRALIRLPAAHFEQFAAENTAYRDIARCLARTRDADVMGRTFDKLADREQLVGMEDVRRALVAGARQDEPGTSLNDLLHRDTVAALIAARRRIRRWRFGRKGFRLIVPGLKQVYKGMREAEAIAAEHPSAVSFHEWRKMVKYHAEQLGLLEKVAPEIIAGYRGIAVRLGDTLGQHHDLDVMAAAAEALELATEQRQVLREAIARRNAKLEARAFRLGLELSAERPADLARRIRTGWRGWRHPESSPGAPHPVRN